MVNISAYQNITAELSKKNVRLVAVSKLKTVADIEALYALGQLDFGENYVQELLLKHEQCNKNIQWHFIGHLQTNKVKYIAPFVHLIHGIDSMKLLKEVNKQAKKNGRIINCLLQVYIAREESKFGLSEEELNELLQWDELPALNNICIKGLMGMASFSSDKTLVANEFSFLNRCYQQLKAASAQHSNINAEILSMGMSNDYELAVANGSTMVRIGSLLFGNRS